jgi:tRNA(Ile)-lysidine synthase
MDAADPVLEAVRAGGLLGPGGPVLVMLSGGRDSTCLLDVTVRIAGAKATRALHVNYGLRESAAGDELHCAQQCERLGVPLHVERPGPRDSGNLQAWARDVRYSAAEQLAEPREAVVATGHTLTDQAETILYRLAASPGRRALLGMRPREGRVVRPLLAVTREQTAEYCRARGLDWREDDSNRDPMYARARVREGLAPALRALHPAAERNVARTAELLRDEADVLDAVVGEVLQGGDRVEVARLAALPPALRRLVARRLAEDATGRLVPAAAARVDELLDLDDGELHLEAGVRAEVRGGVLSFASLPRPVAARSDDSAWTTRGRRRRAR